MPCDAKTAIGSEVASSYNNLSPSSAEVFSTIKSPALLDEPSVPFKVNPDTNSIVPGLPLFHRSYGTMAIILLRKLVYLHLVYFVF